jgi:hypothetical protein
MKRAISSSRDIAEGIESDRNAVCHVIFESILTGTGSVRRSGENHPI